MSRATDTEIQAVLRLDGPARFSHFVKRVADSEGAWGLWNDGWALMKSDDGTQVFPLWPAREYAELHRSGGWANHEAREIPFAYLLDELVPRLAQRGVLPGVFPTLLGKGVTVAPEELAASLRNELKNYA